MLKLIYLCVTYQHDWRLVVLAGLVCLFACFTATNLYVRAEEAPHARRLPWMFGASVVFGFGVWTTHFIAELAYSPGIPISYDPALTTLSAIIAVLVTWLGIVVAFEFSAAAGGGIIGSAVGAMHYVGVLAMRAPAVFHWNAAFVVASIAVGVALSSVAFHVQSRGSDVRLRIATALLLVLAIVGLHFTAMTALTLAFDPTVPIPSAAIAPELLATAVAGVTAVVITIGLAGAVADGQMAQRAKSEAVTLARRVEERTAELRAVQAELLHRERLSTMGLLTATVAHELRNPLSAVRNSLFVIREALTPHEIDLDRPLSRAERSIGRCDRIISDLLDYTRGRELRCAPLAVDAWVEETVRAHALLPGITVEHDYRAPDCVLNCDIERMRRVVVNVIENAAQALGDSAGDRRIVVSTRVADEHFELSVVDSGPGIAAEVLPRVFEPLFSTKSFGTGLGLPAVKQIVEQHGGTVHILSAPGAGASVVVRLPLPKAQTLAA